MADTMQLQNDRLTLTTDEGKKVELPDTALIDMIREEIEPPINGAALPDGVKFVKWQAPYMSVVHQLPAHVRQVRWIKDDSPVPFGHGATYQTRRLSLPYAITFSIFFRQGQSLSLMGYDELYFRTAPLKTKADSLGYAALLNVSRIDIENRQRAWICTQHLHCRPGSDWIAQLAELLNHTWNGEFNRSSEHHEGASWYGESAGIHPDLHPIEKWEQASAANDVFALGVPWKPVKMNVGQLMDAMLDECHSQRGAKRMPGPKRSKGKRKTLMARFMAYAQRKKDKDDQTQ